MKPRPLLVASDIGGTLTNQKNILPDFCIRTLNKLMAMNIPVVLATGYNYRTACQYIKELDERIGILALNGTIAAEAGKVIWEYQIPEPQARELYFFLKDFGHPIFMYQGQVENFRNYLCKRGGHYSSDAFIEIDEMTDFQNTIGLSTRVPNAEVDGIGARIKMVIQAQFQYIVSRGKAYSWLEITPIQAKKDLALQRYCRQHSLALSQVIYFGDNFNDLEVLKTVGYPVIMENAVDELKKMFMVQVKPVELNGVAHYLNDLYDLGLSET